MPKLTLVDGEKQREIVFEGEKLLSELLQSEAAELPHPCGGRGVCKKCTVIINGKEELSCRFKVSADTTVIIPQNGEIFSVSGADETKTVSDNMCLCLDIGTTTLALALVAVDNKSIVETNTSANPQSSFGADVISRIDYCAKNGVTQLHNAVIGAVNAMIEELLGKYGIESISTMLASGNTTMLHLFFGVDCSSMGVSPYTPAFLDSKTCEAFEIGIKRVGKIISLPNMSSFVGADITAGINRVGYPHVKGKYNLLVDLGTNAEIALFDGEKIYCTAAAAGPCFEGANITCGMPASEGAVYSYSPDGRYETIGNSEPKGICATGLVDIISSLVKREVIDESGYMEDDFNITESVMLTPKDVREFQLAKSAVSSAIECLADYAGITFDDVESLYVAGGFSSKLKVENAAHVGLIPKELCEKFVPVNNSSLLGTAEYAWGKNIITNIAQCSEYVDVSLNGKFSEKFMENMFFGEE